MRLLKGWRRHRLRALQLPAEWERFIERNVVFCDDLSAAQRRELFGNTQVLLAEKKFEGCDGLVLTDEIRVTVAAYAAALLLGRETDFYPKLTSILVYPDAYVASGERHVGEGIWEDGDAVRFGQTGLRLSAVVVAWDDIPRENHPTGDGGNVVLHEFAHQLDFENGSVDGTPLLEPGQHASWARVCEGEFERLRQAVANGEPTFIDRYGAKNPTEFFAVVTELFFHCGRELRDHHPDLYREFESFYRLDPARWGRAERLPPSA